MIPASTSEHFPAPDRETVPTPSVGTVDVGGRRVTISIWPPKTWTLMDFPSGVGRASGGQWFAARVD